MPRYCFIYVVSLLFSVRAVAQLQLGFRVIEYGTENGLPANGIKGLALDEQTGFLWIGTEAGIVRFNGIDFRIFDRNNLPELSSERISYLIRNNKGAIFAADQNDHLFGIQNNLPVSYQPEHSDPAWFYPRQFSQAVADSTLGRKIRYPAVIKPIDPIIKIVPLGDTAALLQVNSHKIYYLSKSAKEMIPVNDTGITIHEIFKIEDRCFAEDRNNHFFEMKLSSRQFEPVSFENAPGPDSSTGIKKKIITWQSGMKNPILFSGNNAWLLTYNRKKIIAQLICNHVPSNTFIGYAQYSEKNKILFIGTDSKGLIVIRQNSVMSVKNSQLAISDKNAYYSQVALNNGNVLTNEGHVIGMNKDAPVDLPIRGAFNVTVKNINDSILVYSQADTTSNTNCLHVYHYKTRKTDIYPKIVVRQTFAAAYSDGKLYVALDRGLGLLQGDSLHFIFRPHHPPNGTWRESSPLSMQETTAGVFLVASCNGLMLYDTHLLTKDTLLQLPGYCVRSINKIGDYYFIGTYGKGYYIYYNGQIKNMPLDKNNFLLYTHCIVTDEEGFCWISTNRGLFKAKFSDLTHAFEKNSATVYYHYLGKKDGMEMTEMNGGCHPCALKLKNNIISFPTMDGLLWVNPSDAKILLPDGNIFIDEILADDVVLDGNQLSLSALPASTKSLVVNISYSAWCNIENIHLDYRLKADEKWQPLKGSTQRIIRIENLPYGKYDLQIRKLNGFGDNNYTYKELSFVIEAPWYRRWWFYLLCVGIAVAIVRLFLYLKTRQYRVNQDRLQLQVAEKTQALQKKNEALEKNNQINNRLISIISHDIITPLKFMTVGGKELIANRKIMPQELQEETIEEITNTAQELQFLTTNIMNWIKYQNENRRQEKESFLVHEVVDQVIAVLQSVAKKNNISIANEVDENLLLYQYREPLKILVYNLVSNAIHFSAKGVISISCNATADQIVLHVKDEGIGMTQQQIQNIMSDEFIISSANIDNRKGNGLGYLIIKDLLKMMNATLSIQSEKWRGTIVSLSIPSKERPGINSFIT